MSDFEITSTVPKQDLPHIKSSSHLHLQLTTLRRLSLASTCDGWKFAVFDFASLATRCLYGLDDFHGLVVCNLTKDDVLSVEPTCNDSGDEKSVGC